MALIWSHSQVQFSSMPAAHQTAELLAH